MMFSMIMRIGVIFRSCPRIWLAGILLVSFVGVHMLNLRRAEARLGVARGELERLGCRLSRSAEEALGAGHPCRVIVEQCLERFRPASVLPTGYVFSRPDASDYMDPAKTYDQNPDVYALLHEIRSRDLQTLGGISDRGYASLIQLCILGANRCLEKRDTVKAAEILLDAWHIYRIHAQDPDIWREILSKIDVIRQAPDLHWNLFKPLEALGPNLKPNDPARDRVLELARRLDDESFLKSACLTVYSVKLGQFEQYRERFPLLKARIDRDYASQAEGILPKIRGFDLDHYSALELAKPPFYFQDRYPPASVTHDGLMEEPIVQLVKLNRFQNRLNAVALACQVHRMDHKTFPESVERLVPDYIASISSTLAKEPQFRITKQIFPSYKRTLLTANAKELLKAYFSTDADPGIPGNSIELYLFDRIKADPDKPDIDS